MKKQGKKPKRTRSKVFDPDKVMTYLFKDPPPHFNLFKKYCKENGVTTTSQLRDIISKVASGEIKLDKKKKSKKVPFLIPNISKEIWEVFMKKCSEANQTARDVFIEETKNRLRGWTPKS